MAVPVAYRRQQQR